MINKILIANRGEIAIRIMRACRELGILSVAVYSESDKDALFAKYADESYYLGSGPASENYLNIEKIVEAANRSGAYAVHPGYGFLSENPSFAYACESEGLKFIGPSSRILELMGNKIAARQAMERPFSGRSARKNVTGFHQAKEIAADIATLLLSNPPVAEAVCMSVVYRQDELQMLSNPLKDCLENFGIPMSTSKNMSIIPAISKFKYSRFVRKSSISANANAPSAAPSETIEEAPSPVITRELREKWVRPLLKPQVRSVRRLRNDEFLYSNGEFYFMEANTRVRSNIR
jgi:pyruvate carboxylase subunit A